MSPRSKESWFEVKEIKPNLFGIAESGHYEEVNSFLLLANKAALLIDTGMGMFSIKEAVDRITTLPVSVINTHSHFDHVGSNHEFQKISMFDCNESDDVAKTGFSEKFLAQFSTDEQLYGKRPDGFPNPYTIPPFQITNRLFEGADIIEIPYKLGVVHTPGHSDDSICLYEPTKGWLFTGDLLYDGPIFIEAKGGLAKFRRSIEKVAQLDNVTGMFSSHNYFEFPIEKFEKLRLSLDQILTDELEHQVPIEGRLRLVPYSH